MSFQTEKDDMKEGNSGVQQANNMAILKDKGHSSMIDVKMSN